VVPSWPSFIRASGALHSFSCPESHVLANIAHDQEELNKSFGYVKKLLCDAAANATAALVAFAAAAAAKAKAKAEAKAGTKDHQENGHSIYFLLNCFFGP
jgi:hypothetical protein